MNKKLISKIKDFYKKNSKELLDIIIFGSTMRGKDAPNDLDILMLFHDKENEEITYALRKLLGQEKPEIVSKIYSTYLQDNFIAREAVLKEGFSIVYNNYLSKKFGYTSLMMIRYDLKFLTKSKKITFYYSLYGRNGSEGMLKRLQMIKFSESTLLCPIEHSEEVKDYLSQQKIRYDIFQILIPTRLVSGL